MRRDRSPIWFVGLAGLIGFLGAASAAYAQAPAQPPAAAPAPQPTQDAGQERRFFSVDPRTAAPAPAPVPPKPFACSGPITRVIDVGTEGIKTTTAVFGSNPGGGEGKQFDRTPLLSATVKLVKGACLNAHLSALVGGKVYSFFTPISNLTLFQVTLTRSGSLPQHMVGHFETPYGIPSPAVALEAERDVDMFAANFFQKVGIGPHEVPPGTYTVDVWWAGAPPSATPGGAIGFTFVLKLYLQ